MIRLTLPTEPFWLEIGGGAAFFVRPPTTQLLETARAAVRREIEATREAADLLRVTGMPLGETPDYSDAAVMQGHVTAALPRMIARYAVTRWRGFGDEAGNELPLTPANLDLAMRIDAIARSFFAGYLLTLAELDAEKNASAPGPSGNSEPGATTAEAALPPAGTAG